MEVRSQSFGSYLLERGLVPRGRLEKATQVMVVFGGRLGTVLVEAGYLSVEEVEKHLSSLLGLPPVPRERLGRIDRDALDTIPAELAKRYALLPLWIEKNSLHVAMLDPQDADLIDSLSFATDMDIKPYVIAERRLVQLLDRHYEIRPDTRFTDYRILEMAGHVKPARDETCENEDRAAKRDSTAAAEDDDTLRQRAVLGISPLEAAEELSDATFLDSMEERGRREIGEAPDIELTDEVETPTTPSALEPASTPAEVAKLEHELALVADREAVMKLTLRIAAFYARNAALFLVRDEMIQGVYSAGETASERVDGIYVPVRAPSMLGGPATDSMPFRGRPQPSGIDGSVVRLLSDAPPADAAVLAVSLQGRAVNLLYIENGEADLAESSLAALANLCETTAAAYARLVLESKRKHLAPVRS